MSKTRERGHKIIHNSLWLTRPNDCWNRRSQDEYLSLLWVGVRQELEDIIGLGNETIQSYLDDSVWVERFTRLFRAY